MSGGESQQFAKRVSISDGKIGVYGAVGVDSASSKWFIRHVGMSLEEADFANGKPLQLRMVDMGPPLGTPESSSPENVDVVGTATLTSDDASIINTFICEQIDEYKSLKTTRKKQYVVCPHFVKGDGLVSARRYSCAGFVFECYFDLGISLVDIDALPHVDESTLAMVYPLLPRILEDPEWRLDVGLAEDGPWPVLLPGYLFHSLNRGADRIRQAPYQPSPGDECFPRLESIDPSDANA
jgi:hypothetical protein